MKTFSRLSLFTLVCFGFAVMLIGNTANAAEHDKKPAKVIFGGTPSADASIEHTTGDPVKVEFRLIDRLGRTPEGQYKATVAIKGLTGVTVDGARYDDSTQYPFDPLTGLLIVDGKFGDGLNTIEVSVIGYDVRAIVGYRARPDGVSPATIVVNEPQPKEELKIGDTFTQVITIENREIDFPTLPLSAWQMDVVFNPLILEVVDVEEGGFLESDGKDAVYVARTSSGKISVSQARAGQMPNADPALPNVATAPSPAGIDLAPGDTGELLTITFRVLAVSEEVLGIHNVRLQSDTDKDGDGSPDRMSYSILVVDVAVTTHQSSRKEDVNQDGEVNILDLVMVAGNIGVIPHNPRADVNGDGSVNVLDLITVYTSDVWGKTVPFDEVAEDNVPALTAPSASRNVTPTTIQSWIDLARIEDDGSAIFERGIANLETLLTSQIPSKTKLLLNYPNPFNPETWIPYQLAEATDVTVTIHATNGSLIRTLALGHQAAGIYKSKSQAAYWDGRNELGEHVASGLYFYTLTAGKFSATGKMLVRK